MVRYSFGRYYKRGNMKSNYRYRKMIANVRGVNPLTVSHYMAAGNPIAGYGTGRFKLKGLINITSDGSGNILNALRLTQPDSFDGAGTSLTDWSSVANLYDAFRITGILFQYTPDLPNDVNATAQYRPVYTFIDFDNTGVSPTDPVAIGYGNMKIMNMYRPWKRYIKIPKLASSATSTTAPLGFFDTASPRATGAFYLSKAGGFSNTLTYGVLVCTYYIKAIFRK